MTDERLNQILKQALTPEIPENEIMVKKKGRRNMKKIVKSVVAVAACCALVIAGGAAIGHFGEKESNPFTVHVMAKELKEGEPVYIGEYTSNSYGLTGWVDGKVGYIVTMPLTCEGKNIESVTYRIKNAAFSFLETGDSIIVDSEKYDGDTTEIGFDGAKEELLEGASSGSNYISSYTVNYEKQTSDTTWINICGNHELSEQEYKSACGEYDAEKTAKMFDKLLEDVVITCTVNFKDGTTSTKDVVIGAQTMTQEAYEKVSSDCEEQGESMGDEVFSYLKFELK